MSFEDVERSDRGDGFQSEVGDESGSFPRPVEVFGEGSGFVDSKSLGFVGDSDGFVLDGLEGVEEVGRRRSEGRVEEERFLETEGWERRNATNEGRESARSLRCSKPFDVEATSWTCERVELEEMRGARILTLNLLLEMVGLRRSENDLVDTVGSEGVGSRDDDLPVLHEESILSDNPELSLSELLRKSELESELTNFPRELGRPVSLPWSERSSSPDT